MKNWHRQITALAFFASGANAASPHFSGLSPTGGQRGTEVEVAFQGERLWDARGVLFYTPGIEAGDLKAVSENQFTAKVKIPADCPLGEHPLRLWTASGITEMRTFWVGPFPVVESKNATVKKDAPPSESNAAPDQAQTVPLNSTVTGYIKNETTDWFSVELKKGQRLSVDVEGLRLATVANANNNIFDPYLTISRPGGEILARCDDNMPGRFDPALSIVAPEDGRYLIALRDSTYGGGDKAKYRMHIGTFPLPATVYPPGGKAGEEIALTFLGDATGPIEAKVKLPADDTGKFRLLAEKDGLTSPAPSAFRISPFPNVLEAEPNNDTGHASATELPPPLAFNGILSEKNDIDFFKFNAAKGQPLEVNVWARRLRSPLDSVLKIYNAKGSEVAANDDANGPDSYLRFNPPEDGAYFLSVTDHMRRGGATFTYRVEITPVVASLSLTFPIYEQNSQRHQTITVARGNRIAKWLRVKRADTGEEIVPSFADLPAGVKAEVVPVPPNSDVVPVIFEAAADAPVAAKLCSIDVESTKPENKIRGHMNHEVELMYGSNNVIYLRALVDRAAVSVADEAPFSITLVDPKVPLLQGGQINLKIVVERKGEFKGAVTVAMLWTPPGLASQSQIVVPEGQTEAFFPMNANGDAPLRKWKLAVVASAEPGKGTVQTSSKFAEMEIAPPFVLGKIEMANVEQGKSVTVVCKLTQQRPFEGKAKVQLLGLPNKATAPDVEITSKDEEVRFQVATEAAAPPGQHKALFCQTTVTQNGEPMVATTAQGGILRIDPPEKPVEKTSDEKKPETKVAEKK